MNALIPSEDMRLLVAHFPARKVEQVRLWCEVCEAFLATPSAQRAAVAKRLATEYAGRITGGLSLKSIYRRAAEYARQGWRGLVPAHALKVATGTAAGIGANEAFLLHWHHLVAANQRVTRPAFNALIAELRADLAIPGYGTWRDIWRAEHPGRAVPEKCPYRIGVLLPIGWSLGNLNRHKPSKWGLKALRTGTMAAANLLPMIPRTRAGLKRGQIVEVDDMWHDVKVRYGTNTPAERVVEFSMVDVATGCLSAWVYKPIRKRDNGTKETLPAKILMAYLVTHWLIVQGYAPEGALICGEHSTASRRPIGRA